MYPILFWGQQGLKPNDPILKPQFFKRYLIWVLFAFALTEECEHGICKHSVPDCSLYFSSRAPGNSPIDEMHEIQNDEMKLTSIVCYILYSNILFYIGVQPVNPGEENRQPTPVFLPGEFHGQRSQVGYSPWGHKEWDTTEWLTHTHSQLTMLW